MSSEGAASTSPRSSTGCFIINFDLELAWGRFDIAYNDELVKKWRLTRKRVVPQLLQILERHNISATWATVGHLMLNECDGRHEELEAYSPPHFPQWFRLDPGSSDDGNSVWLARSTVEEIARCPVPQEIASHTFSHVEFGSAALTPARACQELEISRELISGLGQQMRSLIFPRGNKGHLDAVREAGIRVCREADLATHEHPSGLPRKLAHFATELFALTPPTTVPQRDPSGLLALRGSMLYNRRGRFRGLIPMGQRVTRAVRGLQQAARKREVFLLWTHPADFADSPQPMLGGFEHICAHAAKLRDESKLSIVPLGEVESWWQGR